MLNRITAFQVVNQPTAAIILRTLYVFICTTKCCTSLIWTTLEYWSFFTHHQRSTLWITVWRSTSQIGIFIYTKTPQVGFHLTELINYRSLRLAQSCESPSHCLLASHGVLCYNCIYVYLYAQSSYKVYKIDFKDFPGPLDHHFTGLSLTFSAKTLINFICFRNYINNNCG